MLHVHRAERADGLVAALGELLAQPPDDPFAPEVVAVPTRGMERWLTQRLSAVLGAQPGHGDGVCANVEFPSPARLITHAVATAAGVDPDDDPWLPERSVWPLLEVVEAALEEDWLRPLAHFIGPEPHKRNRRFRTVRHLAGLFDRYGLYRPELIAAWRAGGGEHWQAELWRRLRDRLGPSPAERRGPACARLAAEPGLLDLPERLSVFGLTRLPAGRVEVLRALAAGRDVHLYLLHPSPALWEALRDHPPVVRRADDDTGALVTNRLLASWGRDSRELQLVLGEHVAHHHPVEHPQHSLLARLQKSVREDTETDQPVLHDPADRSVEIHACHGRARQVEILRDAILHLLEDDPTLEPRDVIVMCPDIEAFAPLIQATFGAGEIDDEETLPADVRPPDLRVRLADRSLRQTNGVLGVVGRLLELAGERLTASQVLDLADREPVRRRFHLDDDALARAEEWVSDSGTRWGLDQAHRAPFKLDGVEGGTWRRGLDRLLTGVTMTEDIRLIGDVLPLDNVQSGSIDLAGRFTEMLARLERALDGFTPQPVAGWAEAIGDAADALTATPPSEAWQRAELGRILNDMVAEAGEHDTPLGLPEIRALISDRIEGRPTRANFRTGHLTICTLVPMRSVPHRVVCLLGLDDGAFPRKAPRDGDDLTLDDPHLGDRDPRSEDRQQLLDALLAARDKLIVTYTGADERTNAPRPPAVPVGELLDAIERTVSVQRDTFVVRHPLQPFDPRNFRTGELTPGQPWGFDRVTLGGALELLRDRPAPPGFLPVPLSPAPPAPLAVQDLVSFVRHPVRAFLRQRLGISVADYTDELKDGLPVELDNLESWGVAERLLKARLAGVDMADARRAELARGLLPPGALGAPVIEDVVGMVEAITATTRAALEGLPEPGSVDVRLTLPDGRVLGGTVPGVCGDLLCTSTYSRIKARQRLTVWVQLLVLSAAHPGRPFTAVTIGRKPRGNEGWMQPLPALGADVALERLLELIDLYDRAMVGPPPLACATSAAYALGAAAGQDPAYGAGKEWETGFNDRFDKEDREEEHRLVHGGVVGFDTLLEEEPLPGEDWGFEDDPSRFGRWARRLWTPLLEAEAGS